MCLKFFVDLNREDKDYLHVRFDQEKKEFFLGDESYIDLKKYDQLISDISYLKTLKELL